VADKYLFHTAGTLTEVEALDASTGAGDAGSIVALDSAGRIDSSMMPVGLGADTASVEASETLAAGDYVNLHDGGAGEFRVRKADAASAGKEAHGFVLAGASAAAQATVYFEGTNTQVSGAAPGPVYLSPTTPGVGTATAPTGSGQVVQRLGVSSSASAVNFEPYIPIVLA
jgi:hypothetical protein